MTGGQQSAPDGDELNRKVYRWLQEGGFPLELRVANLFSGLGWTVYHADGYRDPLSGKVREIDIVAEFERAVEGEAGFRRITMKLVIECKSSPSKPWVVLASEVDEHVFWAKHAVSGIGEWIEFQHLCQVHHFPVPYPFAPAAAVGFGVVTALTANDGNTPVSAYAALTGVRSAVEGLAGVGNFDLKRNRLRAHRLVIWAPVVVCDTRLFLYSRGTEEDYLKEIGHADVRLSTAERYAPFRVSVITEGQLASLAGKLTQDLTSILDAALGSEQHFAEAIAMGIADTEFELSQEWGK